MVLQHAGGGVCVAAFFVVREKAGEYFSFFFCYWPAACFQWMRCYMVVNHKAVG